MWPFKKQAVVSQEQVSLDVAKMRLWTPDMAELEKKQSQLLFVCDEMLPGHWKNELLQGQERLYTAFTQHPHVMFMHDLGTMSYPIVFDDLTFQRPRPPFVPFLPIRGKLFRVQPRLFLKLDEYRLNTVQFERKQVCVVIPHTHIWFKEVQTAQSVMATRDNQHLFQRQGVLRAWAWMYLGKKDHWDDLLNAFEFPAVGTYKDNRLIVREYYDFNLEEYAPPF